MKFVDIEVFCIAQTKLNRVIARKWLDSIGAREFQLRSYDDATDAAQLVELAGRRCYKAFDTKLNPNLTKLRTVLTDYLDNILKSAHGSVLEHCSFTFAIEGLSRVCTAELNRHRAGAAISEGSMRYIRFRDIEVTMPNSIRLTEEEKQWLEKATDSTALSTQLEVLIEEDLTEIPINWAEIRPLLLKKMKTQLAFERVFKVVEEEYQFLQTLWEAELAPTSTFRNKKNVTSMMRRIVPMGVATGGVWSYNIRSLRHILEIRNSEGAEEEILQVATMALKLMAEKEPMIFGDFQLVDGYWAPKYHKV